MADTPVRSRRPYLLRAMHEWISDSNQTPHIVVDASIEGVEVPRQYVQGGKIILNVSSNATSMLSLGNEVVRLRETGQGMIFSEADTPPQPPAPPSEPAPTTTGEGKRSKPTLKVIK
jgi:stringent starvation protein B